MSRKPRLFISVPDDRHLDDRRQRLKRSIIAFIAKQDFEPVGFESEQFCVPTQPTLNEWSVERACALLRRCDGAVVLALARTYAHVLKPGTDVSEQYSLTPQPHPTPPHIITLRAASQSLKDYLF
jgi:hypothetical protein